MTVAECDYSDVIIFERLSSQVRKCTMYTRAPHIYAVTMVCLHTKINVIQLIMCVSVEQYIYGFVVIAQYF